jgi:hypothetical protein
MEREKKEIHGKKKGIFHVSYVFIEVVHFDNMNMSA